MTPEAYQEFLETLRQTLDRDPRVVGLVAAGSTAGQSHSPDQWSDHDVLVITQPGTQEAFRTDLGWLPQAPDIVFHFRETEHGLKVIYASGHMVEFAIFDPEELYLARLNDVAVLLDRADIARRVDEIRAATTEWARTHAHSDLYKMGLFLTDLLVGAGHYARGEHLSARFRVKEAALRHLVALIVRHMPADRPELLDNLEVLRRFEFAYPALGLELNRIMDESPLRAALDLLDLAGRLLGDRMPDFPAAAVAVVRTQVERAAAPA